MFKSPLVPKAQILGTNGDSSWYHSSHEFKNSTLYLLFKLNIPRVEVHLMRESLSPHVRKIVRILIK
jgi:hypothetical protein